MRCKKGSDFAVHHPPNILISQPSENSQVTDVSDYSEASSKTRRSPFVCAWFVWTANEILSFKWQCTCLCWLSKHKMIKGPLMHIRLWTLHYEREDKGILKTIKLQMVIQCMPVNMLNDFHHYYLFLPDPWHTSLPYQWDGTSSFLKEKCFIWFSKQSIPCNILSCGMIFVCVCVDTAQYFWPKRAYKP